MYVCTYVCVCMYVCMYVRMYVCMYLSMFVCIYMYIAEIFIAIYKSSPRELVDHPAGPGQHGGAGIHSHLSQVSKLMDPVRRSHFNSNHHY
jgi:hypothetical protein